MFIWYACRDIHNGKITITLNSNQAYSGAGVISITYICYLQNTYRFQACHHELWHLWVSTVFHYDVIGSIAFQNKFLLPKYDFFLLFFHTKIMVYTTGALYKALVLF